MTYDLYLEKEQYLALDDIGNIVPCDINEKYQYPYWQRVGESTTEVIFRFKDDHPGVLDERNDEVFDLMIGDHKDYYSPSIRERQMVDSMNVLYRTKKGKKDLSALNRNFAFIVEYSDHLSKMEYQLEEAREWGIDYFQEITKRLDIKRRDLHNDAITALNQINTTCMSTVGKKFYNSPQEGQVDRHDITEFIVLYRKTGETLEKELAVIDNLEIVQNDKKHQHEKDDNCDENETHLSHE